MYLNFPMIAAGNFSNNGFLKPDNRTTTIEGGVISVYRPENENPTPPPDPSAIPDWWVNSSKRNILSPAIYDTTHLNPVDIYDIDDAPISPTIWQTSTIQSNTPQYYLLSGNYQATASQYIPAGIPEYRPAAVLTFDTGNRKAQRITGELVDYNYDIPLFEVTTGLQSSYKLKLWYSFNDNVVSCGIDIYDGDTKVEGFDMDNTDLGYTYNLDSESISMLNYFIAGGDTVKQETTHGTGTPIIKNNLVIMDFIHAERISNSVNGNVTSFLDGNYNCYHCGVALDLNYLKTTYNVMLSSDWLTVEEVPDFWNNSYLVNLYHGGNPSIVQSDPCIVPGTGVSPDRDIQMYVGIAGQREPHISMFDEDLGYYTKAVNPTIIGISDVVRPFEYDIPLYDSNNDLSDYRIKIDYTYKVVSHMPEARIFLSIYYQDTLIASHNTGCAPAIGNVGSPEGPYFFAGADTFNTTDANYQDPIVETNDLLVIGFLQKQSTNSSGTLIDDSDTEVTGGLLGFDLSYIEQTYGVHLSEDQLTTTT